MIHFVSDQDGKGKAHISGKRLFTKKTYKFAHSKCITAEILILRYRIKMSISYYEEIIRFSIEMKLYSVTKY